MVNKKQTYTNDGAKTQPKTQNTKPSAKVDNNKVVRDTTDASNLAGTNNIKNAVGTVRGQSASKNNMLSGTPSQNAEKGKTFIPNSTNITDPTKPVTTKQIKQTASTLIQQGKQNAEAIVQDHVNKINEAKRKNALEIQNQKKQERENRLNLNPDYEMDFYEFADENGNKMSSREYKSLVENNKMQFDSLELSMQNIAKQYQESGDYNKYINDYNQLANKYQQLYNEYNDLQKYQINYNETALQEYEANKARMAEIIKSGHNYRGAEEKRLMDEEYATLKARNEELKPLVDDITSIQEEDKYNWLLEQGDEAQIREHESYIASQDDGFIYNRLKDAVTYIGVELPSYVLSAGDIAYDLIGERAGNTLYSIGEQLTKNNIITDEQFDAISNISKEISAFEYDNENNLSWQLRDYRRKVKKEINSGDKSTLELISGELIDSALENSVRRALLAEYTTLAMGLGTFADTYYESKANGYGDNVSLLNSLAKAGISALSEELGSQRYFELLGTTAGAQIDKEFFSILAQRMISMIPQEMAEEGVEYIGDYFVDVASNLLEPNVNDPQFVPGDMLRAMLMAGGSTAISALTGAVASSFTNQQQYYIPPIRNVQEYKQLSLELDRAKQIVADEPDLEQRLKYHNIIRQAEIQKKEFEEKSITAGKIDLQSDGVINTNQQIADSMYKSALLPTVDTMSNEQAVTDDEIQQEKSLLLDISRSALSQRGIIMDAQEYLDMNDRQRNIINKLSSSFNLVEGNGVQLRFSTSAKKGGEYGVDKETGQPYILVNPNSNTLTTDIFKHEIVHAIKNSKAWSELKGITDKLLGKNKEAKKQMLRNADYKEADLEEELVSYVMQDKIDLNTLLHEIGRKDHTILEKLNNIIDNFVRNIKGEEEAERLGRIVGEAYRDTMQNPRLTPGLEIANNDDDELQGQNIRTLRTVQDIDTLQGNLGEYDVTDGYLEEQRIYDERYNRTHDGYFSRPASKTIEKSKVENNANDNATGLDEYQYKNGVASFENKTIDEIINNNIRDEDYELKNKKKAIFSVSPAQFIYLTAQGYTDRNGETIYLDTLREEVENLDENRLKQSIRSNEYDEGPIRLIVIRDENGNLRVSGHQGRHRMWSMYNKGIDSVPIVVYFDKDISIDELNNKNIYVQANGYGYDYYLDRSTNFNDGIIANKNNRNLLYQKYGNGRDADLYLNKDISLLMGNDYVADGKTIAWKDDGLSGKLSQITDVEINDELEDLIAQAEEQIVMNGKLTETMQNEIKKKLYESTWDTIESESTEPTSKDVRRYFRKTPVGWKSFKGDNRKGEGMIDFQREFRFFNFVKDGTPWDIAMMEFAEVFPGAINPDNITSGRDFGEAVKEYMNELDELHKDKKIDPHNYDEFSKQFDNILSGFTKANEPQYTSPKTISKRQTESMDRTREAFRNSVREWVGNYEVLRNKYDIFSDKTFDDALADVYVNGDVTNETKEKLVNEAMSDYDLFMHPEWANQFVESFTKQAVEYYLLESQYMADQQYQDTITRTANIVNQAQKGLYEKDYDRSVLADEIDKKVELLNKLEDFDIVHNMVQTIIENTNDPKNLLYNRSLKKYNDLVANGNEAVRQLLYEITEQPVRTAQMQELAILKNEISIIQELQKETGIKMYSKEDEAIGWIVEGKKQDGTKYTINDLKKDFPNKWKNIQKVSNAYTNLVGRWYDEEKKVADETYGDIEYQNQVKTAKLENEYQTALNIFNSRELDLRRNPNAKTQAGYSQAKKSLETVEKRLNAQRKRNQEHVETRRQYAPYRKNYFHHTNEVHFVKNARALMEQIKNGNRAKNRIPSELAGMTDVTKPKSTIQSYKWRQGEKNYSSSGFASLEHRLLEHANAIAFDPTVSYLRNIESIFRDLDAESKSTNYIAWLTKYTNNLSGKTNDLDRLLREMTPDETLGIINTLNNRAKKNAVYGNISSALVQAGNFPAGMGLAVQKGGKEALQDLIKGTAQRIQDTKSGINAKDLSTMMALRYFDTNLKDARALSKIDDFGQWTMEVLDKVTAETLWYTYKAQGERLGESNPLLYADDMLDRAIQSRRPEDLPLSQQSKIIQTLAPFQVEVNNQWQLMKDMTKSSFKGDNKINSIAGMVTLMITSALMNAGFEAIIKRKPLFDPLGAIYETLAEPDYTDGKLVGRLIGETLSAMPYGQYIPSILGMDEDKAKAVFGESDPSRYGTGNIGISTLAELVRSAMLSDNPDDFVHAIEDTFFTYGMPGFGRQAQRVYQAGQEFGYAPQYVNGEWVRTPIHYTNTGGVGFANDPGDVFDFMRSVVGGRYATKAGQEYINSNFKKLGIDSLKDENGETISGSKALQIRKELQELGAYDNIVSQINDGKMTLKQAGLTEKVFNMNDEEFNQAYNSMTAKYEGISNKLQELYDWSEQQMDDYQNAIDIEPDYKDGKKVTDSEALKTRKALEDAGIYDQVVEYVEQNGLEYTDVGLGKRVVGYDQDKFQEAYNKKIGGK